MPQITSVRTRHVPIPLPSAVVPRGGTLNFVRLDNLVVEVTADNGLSGWGYFWLPGSGQRDSDPLVGAALAAEEIVHTLGRRLVGGPVESQVALWRMVTSSVEHHGRGVLSLAHSALDLALWDLALKCSGQPLHRALGAGGTPSNECYSNGLLDLWDAPLTTLARAAQDLVQRGFRGVKVPLGMHPHDSVLADVRRVGAVRDAVGDDVDVMADVGCRWRPSDVVDAASRLDPLRLRWLEDPLPLDDVEGMRLLRARTTTPVATGENSFDVRQLHRLAWAGAVDVIIFEPMRVGGVTGSVKVMHAAEVTGTGVAPHTYPDLAAQLIPAVLGYGLCEHLAWWEPMLAEPAVLREGRLVPSERPGTGLEVAADVAARSPQRETTLDEGVTGAGAR